MRAWVLCISHPIATNCPQSAQHWAFAERKHTVVTPASAATPSEAVRTYIEYLRDPSKFTKDDSEALAVRTKIAQLLDKKDALDPIAYLEQRVALNQQLQDASKTDDPGVRMKADFVANVREYLRESGATPDMLREVGGRKIIPALREAGLASGGRRSSASRGGGSRAPRLSDAEKQAGVPAKGTFTLATYADAIDRNRGTAVNYVKDLVDSGYITEAGVDESSSSPRKPKLYRKA
jgi:hypothetical protein